MKTKFNIGDTVFSKEVDSIRKFTICGIEIRKEESGKITEEYFMKEEGKDWSCVKCAHEMFSTKKEALEKEKDSIRKTKLELIESLKRDIENRKKSIEKIKKSL